ncbi:hypothetical protein [Dyella acidiphila]|uniref:Uncharacterized protein n=1 Tax=Dyella acidiphila TaxID=2775866 RepID=A0ABR9GCS3_9GAMM|nr:hypothetical protein [Dyella acidiphila]MBE1161846.1 hypothetical protein [Dyella acidiphila]
MGDFLVAYFHTQLEAITSANKLQAYGVQRERVTIHVPEQAEFDASASPQDVAAPSYDLRTEEPPEAPPLSGSTTLAVALKDHNSINDVCSVLKDAGAYLIDVTEKNVAQEYPDM